MQKARLTVDSATGKVRVFFALWPDQRLITALSMQAKQMRRVCGGRAMRGETVHLTLLFLGELPRQRLQSLLDAAKQVHGKSFSLCLERFSCWRHNRIGYLAPTKMPDALEDLVAALRQHVATAGFDFDVRTFSPHITLLRNVTTPAEQLLTPPLEWHAQDFVLVESVPDGTGRHYQVLERWALG